MKRFLMTLLLSVAACLAIAQGDTILPLGTPTNVVLSASAQALQVPAVAKGGSGNMELMASCVGTAPCFFRYDGTTATVNNGFVLPPNTMFGLKLPAATTTFSAISTGAGSTLYLFAIR